MALDPEDKAGALGCAVGLVAIIGVVLMVVFMTGQDLGLGGEREEEKAGTPLTKADPIREKQVVDKAVTAGPDSLKVTAEDAAQEDAEAAKGYVAAVQGLERMPAGSPAAEAAGLVEIERVLAAEPLCYHGRIARHAPSLFSATHGFAVTYGTGTLRAGGPDTGTPLPRLEIFVNQAESATFASYMSLSEDEVKGFPDGREVPMPYTPEAIDGVIGKWIAAVATETCPNKAGELGLTGRGR